MSCRLSVFAAALLAVSLPAYATAAIVYISPNATASMIQEELILAEPGTVIRLAAGTYQLDEPLSLEVDDVTIEGEGMDQTILDFSGQKEGAAGLLITSDDATVQNLRVINTPKDGIKAQDCKRISFYRVAVDWEGEPTKTNGAYGLYPVQCDGVKVDKSYVRGASDAGIYVGQSQNIVVKNSLAEYNVAGIEIENSYAADVLGNVTRHNTAGILVFDLPNLPQQGGHSVRVMDNYSHDNDTANFAAEGTVVADVPRGIGILVMANRHVQVVNNKLDRNPSTHILVVTNHDPEAEKDENYRKHPRQVYVAGNMMGEGGYDMDPEKFYPATDLLAGRAADIVFDGVLPVFDVFFGTDDPALILGSGNKKFDGSDATFVDLDLVWAAIPVLSLLHSIDFDTSSYEGSVDGLPPVILDF